MNQEQKQKVTQRKCCEVCCAKFCATFSSFKVYTQTNWASGFIMGATNDVAWCLTAFDNLAASAPSTFSRTLLSCVEYK